MRLGKAGEPVLTGEADEPWTFGKLRAIRRDDGGTAIISYGLIARQAIGVAEGLREKGEPTSVYFCHTIKPLDVDRIVEVLRSHRRVVVIEETVPTGSLGQRVKQIAWEAGASCRIDAFSLKDEFIHCYGSHNDLLAAHGLEVGQMLGELK